MMKDIAAPVALDLPEPPARRLFHPSRWLASRRDARDNDSTFGFGARLFGTVACTFALIGVPGYVLVERDLAHKQLTDLAAAQRADAKGFEHEGAVATHPTEAIAEIDRLLHAISQRPGTREALLIDQRHVIAAAGNDSLVGSSYSDPHVDAALEHARAYASSNSGSTKDRRDFELVAAVNLPSGRYAFKVIYDHRTFDASLREVRTLLALVGLLALIGGSIVFYLVGGRKLMRDHRIALRRATRDGLTDLPNQRAFQDEFPQAVASAERYRDPFALAVLDVDDFKLVNDRHGHPHGDAILKRVASVLREARPGDRPYRVGGDEFALLLAHTDARGARTVAKRLSRNFKDAQIAASVGVSALRPGLSADTLRAEADAALYEAKRQGGDRSTDFDDIRENVVVTTSDKKEVVLELVEQGRLTTAFQPIWNLDHETLLGVEALARPDPSYGLSGPSEAFDVAEQVGRVHELDVLCVTSALRLMPELDPNVLLFLNLSPLTLDLDSEGNEWFRVAIEQAGLSPHQIVVEVTERFGGRTASVIKCLQRLRGQGFKIAVDDVGTGNSGLEMLRKIDAEFVKLDHSIVAAATSEPGARAVLLAMATFARQTGAFVIAEGIEDEDTLHFLRDIDERRLRTDTIIQGAQGFGLGRPSAELPLSAPALLRSRKELA